MKPLHVIQEKKSDLFKNLFLVVLLSAGISLCANYYSNTYTSNKLLLYGGLICIGIVVVAYVISFYKSKSFVIKTNSLFIVDKDGYLQPIFRYELCEDMDRDLKSVFSENKSFENIWINAFAKPAVVEMKSSQLSSATGTQKSTNSYSVIKKNIKNES